MYFYFVKNILPINCICLLFHILSIIDQSYCHNKNCSHFCQETPDGGKCNCFHGYILTHNDMTCKDIDECKDKNICSQYCTNSDGSYSCSCLNSDYMLRADRSSCKALGIY